MDWTGLPVLLWWCVDALFFVALVILLGTVLNLIQG